MGRKKQEKIDLDELLLDQEFLQFAQNYDTLPLDAIGQIYMKRKKKEQKKNEIKDLLFDQKFLEFAKSYETLSLDAIARIYMRRKNQKFIDAHLKKRKIWQAKDGNWLTRIEDTSGKPHVVQRKSLDDLYDVIIESYKIKLTNPTIGQVFQQWMNERMEYNEIQKGTYDRMVSDFRRLFVSLKFDQRLIRTVNEDDLTEFIKTSIRDNRATKKAWANFKGVIMGLFAYAKDKKYTTLSISAFLGDLRLAKGMFCKTIFNDDEQVFTDEEILLIVNWIKATDERMHSLTNLGILLTLVTGLRAGELSTLKPEDFNGNILTVHRTETRNKGEKEYEFHVREFTKGRDGFRKVIIPLDAMKILEYIHEINPSGEYLFMDQGHRVKGDRFSGKLKRICKYVGIKPRSLHKIRKTYASLLLDSGCNDRLVTKQMGHTDIRTTLAHYYYDREDLLEKLAAIEGALGGIAKTISNA